MYCYCKALPKMFVFVKFPVVTADQFMLGMLMILDTTLSVDVITPNCAETT